MRPESTEELRTRLLGDEQVQDLIRMRAYEIYQMRGSQPGQDAENWFRAENEILTFLIQEESRREAYSREQGPDDERAESRMGSEMPNPPSPSEEGAARPRAFEPQTQPETTDRLQEPAGQHAEQRAESRSALGVWSPTEPASTEPAPPIGSNAVEVDAPAKKKSRARATSKTADSKPAETRKRKTTTSSPKEAPAKKPAARRTATKKSPESK